MRRSETAATKKPDPPSGPCPVKPFLPARSMNRFVVRLEPIEQRSFIRVQSQLSGLFDKPITALRIIVWPRRLDFIAPMLDLVWRLCFAGLVEPFSHLLIAGSIFNLRLEIRPFYPFEPEQHVIERTVEVVIPDIACHQRAALINRAAENGVAADAKSR